MDRFDWAQVQDYWRGQRMRAGDLDRGQDPDALGNVCHAGAPLWLNEYYARHQRRVFEDLLAECPAPAPGARALDVGCGAGRWCRLLAGRGYDVHGIDLQPSLIEENRARYPEMTFTCTAVQNFTAAAPFDLITTVTVIQHLPFGEQRKALEKIASLLGSGGRMIALENVADQGVHVFGNSIDDWVAGFERAGLRLISLRRYDYSPALRASNAAVALSKRLARALRVIPSVDGPVVPVAGSKSDDQQTTLASFARRALWGARHAAVRIDDGLEPLLIRLNASLPTVHCGFLLQKTV